MPEPEQSQVPEPPGVEPSDPDPVAEELESQDIDRAIKWMSEHWVPLGLAGEKCAVCGKGSFQVTGPLALPAFRRQIGDAILPAFAITCTTCGNMQFLNGLVPNNLLVDQPEEGKET
jgi:hypothetical protein